MPPRENPRLNKSLDSVHASGPLGRAHCVIHGNQQLQADRPAAGLRGVLAAAAAAASGSGFASGCQAFGHRELLGVLRAFGLVTEPVLTVQA